MTRGASPAAPSAMPHTWLGLLNLREMMAVVTTSLQQDAGTTERAGMGVVPGPGVVLRRGVGVY